MVFYHLVFGFCRFLPTLTVKYLFLVLPCLTINYLERKDIYMLANNITLLLISCYKFVIARLYYYDCRRPLIRAWSQGWTGTECYFLGRF